MTLADPRLETLRLQAISLRDGGTVDPAFIAAGYTETHAREIAGFMSARHRQASPAARRSAVAHASGIGLALSAIAGFVGLTVTCLI